MTIRIAYLHQYFRTPTMSGGTRSYEMARRLCAAGHEVHMVTSDNAADENIGRKWYETEEAGIRVHWLPLSYSNTMSFRERLAAFCRFAWRAGPRAAAVQPDVIFATSTPLTIALPAVYAARKCRCPMLFEVRDLWPEAAVAIGALKSRASIAAARQLERFAYRNAAGVVALSPRMKQGVMAQGVPDERVTVIPNGCDFDLFGAATESGREFRRRFSWLGDRPLVVYTGALGLVNKVDYLARLAGKVQQLDPDIRFLVVGTGREEPRVRRIAEELRVLNRNFFMLPELRKDEIPAVLAAADLTTNVCGNDPRLQGDAANKFFDSLAAGRPVVINFGGTLAKLIEQHEIGLVLDPSNLSLAAEQLIAMLSQPGQLSRAGSNARCLGEKEFHRDKLFRKLERVLLDVIDGHASFAKQRRAA